MRALVFDLDQTLIQGEDLDWHLWLGAIDRAFGVPVPRDEDWDTHPVHTDHGLLESLSQRLRGRPFGADERVAFEAEVVAGIDAAVRTHPGMFAPIAGAPALLARVHRRAALATGNLHAVTVQKLRASGLETAPMPCSCSADGIDRTELVARALRRVGWVPGAPATSFGDGLWDVHAAAALGIGFIGLAGSDAHEAKLRRAGARRVFRDYTDLDAVLAALEEAEPPVRPAPAPV